MKTTSSFTFSSVLVIFFTTTVISDLDEEVNTTSISDFQNERTFYNNSVCGAVFTENQFVIKSPNYPENYPPDLECNYLLKGPECPTYYEFEFLDFDIEKSEKCTKDRLEIENQEILCGNQNQTKKYFVENGSLNIKFKTDKDSSGIGYNIFVTRASCQGKDAGFKLEDATTELFTETTTELTITESRTQLIESRNFPAFIQEESLEPKCCANLYSTKKFILTSPNFPYSLNKKTECFYRIIKANENICRLRLNFLFFWLGFTNFHNYCPYGSLDIDGKSICGCNKAVQLTTSFGNSDTKMFKFKTNGFYQKFNTGFVVEVTQEECPKKYTPEYYNHFNNNCSHGEGDYNSQINRDRDIPEASIEKLQIVNERTEILDDDDSYLYSKPKVIKSFYFFAAPEYNEDPSLFGGREKTSNMDVSSINSILTNTNYYECSNWNQVQYNYLEKNYGKNLRICERKDDSEAETEDATHCMELNYVNGFFKSPGYPYYYPGNLNICYRFRKQPGYCKIRMLMNDFQIENDVGCTQDYLLLANGDKYCGNGLFKASWTIDLQNKDYEDMRFVTNGYYCGRGFSGVYQQIACQDMTFPINPNDPSIPPLITTSSPINCDKHVKDKLFTIEVSRNHRLCTFTIQRSSKDVCKINISFEKLNLVCGVESLVIDGMLYCGNLTGRIVTTNLYNIPKTILYQSEYSLEYKHDSLKFKVRGKQISDDCLFPEVPAERLLSHNNSDIEAMKTFSENNLNPQKNSKYLIALLNKQFKDICGIVTNTTKEGLPATFCEILINEHNATKCVPLNEGILDVPYKIKKPDTKVPQEVKIIQNIDFTEIDCDKL